MNENINLTKILKNCPVGTEFYHAAYGRVWFICIDLDRSYPIRLSFSKEISDDVSVTSEGFINKNHNGECLLFPSKDQRDWSKFTAPWLKNDSEYKFLVGQYVTDGYMSGQITSIEDNYNCYKILDVMGDINTFIPFTLQDNYHLWAINDAKEGDVLALSWLEDENLWEKIIIFKKYHSGGVKGVYSMPCVEGYGNTFKNGKIACIDEEVPYYSKTWTCNLHPATKEQRGLLFQKIREAGYKWNDETKTLEKLVKDKFDPKTLKPFDKVLARDSHNATWFCKSFSHIDLSKFYKYATNGGLYRYCIPYNDDTKHLVGTTEEAPEFYRHWED